MDTTHLQAITRLRQLVPVSLRHAQTLLDQCTGNAERAAERFKSELLQLLVAKSGLPPTEAQPYLERAHYDIPQALSAIEDARFTLTERILRKNPQDNSRAIGLIADAIEHVENLQRQYWLSFDDIERLAPPLRCFMTLYEWTLHEEWEGFDSALCFHLPQAIAQLRYLQMSELADALEHADQRQRHLRNSHAGTATSTEMAELINQDEAITACGEAYARQRHVLDAALVNLAQTTIETFPR
ncbi:hypothetical protein [Pseudomonas purpurea]|uniref:hypothetical protein n=1 Tax=Pseudomonas purpurea TaxID=3136737 RepID=UPI003262F7F5